MRENQTNSTAEKTAFEKYPEGWEGLLTEVDVTNLEVPETVRRWIMVDR
jgi:hypothetical protein